MLKRIDKKIFFILYNFTVSHDSISKLAVFITKFSSKFFSLIYFMAGGWLVYNGDPKIKSFILIPAFVYLTVKLIPFIYNRKRPFVKYDLQNLVKQRNDHSFPSTHTASSLIISLAVLNVSFELGTLMIGLAVITAVSRIMVGVHYPTDIIGAWLLSLIINLLALQF